MPSSRLPLLPLLALAALLAAGCEHHVTPSARGAGAFVNCPDGSQARTYADCPRGDEGEEEPPGTEGEQEPPAEGEGEPGGDEGEEEEGGGGPQEPPERPAVRQVDPAAGPVQGGTQVTILGSGFVRPTTVTIAGIPIDIDPVRNGGELRFETPCVTGGDECPTPDEEAIVGPVAIEIASENGIVALADGFTYFDSLAITRVTPEAGSSAGGQTVAIAGTGFVEGAVATFGGRTAARTRVISAMQIEAVTPAGAPGATDVRVFTRHGQATAEDAFTFFDEIRLTAVDPPVGPTEGGTVVTLEGAGFTQDAVVLIGLEDTEVLGVSVTGALLTARTPAQEEGARDVRVRDAHGEAVLASAFTYFDPESDAVRVFAVLPHEGSTAGGESVLVVGTGLSRDTQVTFSGAEVACTPLDARRMRCRTPAGEEGPVDVAVESAAGHDTLENGFVYVAPLEIEGVSPASGPVHGGTPITVRGTGFSPGTELLVGVLPGDNARVIDSGTILARTPPGSAGPADVVVRRDGREAVGGDAFTYTDSLRLLAVEPAEGAMAGGTWVTLLGTGFVPGCRLTFGGVAAQDVTVLNGATVTAYTPEGSPGPVDVAVITPTGESWTLEDGFAYFNPATMYGGTWGGPVEGSVNITVLDAMTGDGLPEAWVLLGLDPDTPYHGQTDVRGQITFSGPDVMGEQHVTAYKAGGYGAVSVVAFDAENVTVYLFKPPPSEGEGEGDGLAPCEVSGLVWGLDKYLRPFADPDENEVPMAVVSTTTENMYEDRRPDPGPGARVFGDAPYVLRSRLGDIAVVAMGGIARLDPDSGEVVEFSPMRMGVRRFLFGITEGRIENADIELNIPLSQVASLRFDQPPAGADAGSPGTMSVNPFIVFDAEGVWPLWEYVGYSGQPLGAGFDMVNMPALVHGLQGLSFIIYTSLDTVDMVTGDLLMPFAENYLRDVRSLAEEIDVTPWVGIPRLVQPMPGGDFPAVNRRIAWTNLGGSDPPTGTLLVLFVMDGGGFNEVWEMFVPGHITEVVYPPLPELDLVPPGSIGAALFRSVWVDGLDIDSFEYGDFYYVDSFVAWAQDYDILGFHLH